jgi:hypothetical protein
MAACAQSGNDKNIGRASTAITTNGVTTSSTGACGAAGGVVGRVFDDGSLSAALGFEARVKGLISANYDPVNIGVIESVNGPSKTCVTLQGQFKFDSSGALLAEQTTLDLEIYDSFAEKLDTTGKAAGAYPVVFTKAQSGNLTSERKFTVVFADALGSITVSGTIVQNQIRGQIDYINLNNVTGGAPSSGPLGVFVINTSSLIK